ncbi:glycosyltransferase [Candidatus Uabimicrobium amorphum]|uniref:Glycosyl transferase n=1 Tax=Uabimicrobium amorphum TaxID=2596890 RepID=A0A5S9IP43_UABAM|nr:glycosyltransferase [Candidatus Uabimicrobium amorphum]BBM85097.1 glycosyl transferase [Candidatus Uabimicrobium amorphum]
MDKRLKINIIIPVFNDWDCLKILVGNIHRELAQDTDFRIFAINDCSTIDFPQETFAQFNHFEVVHLTRNMGHQKAISIGISYITEHEECDAVIVMDADGEDRPQDLPKLIEKFKTENKIVFAKRNKRQESLTFRFFYHIYKYSFLLLVGKEISFGNYCIIPYKSLKVLAHVSEIWNHFSGGVIRSKLPYTAIPLDRGKRLSGTSKMNFVALVIHGISSYTVYLEVVVVRLLILLGILIAISIISSITVVSLRLFTNLAIPGWATYTMLGLILIILQAFFVMLHLAMTVLHYRTQRLFIPALHYKNYIKIS